MEVDYGVWKCYHVPILVYIHPVNNANMSIGLVEVGLW